MVPSFIHFFHFWGREADRGRGFSFPLSALIAHGVFSYFLLSLLLSLFLLTCFSSWSLPSLVIQIDLN
jgi:hypothetical protein